MQKTNPVIHRILPLVLLAALIGYLGSDRKFGFWGNFFVSLLLTPIIGLLVVAIAPRKDSLNNLETQLQAAQSAKEKGLITEDEYQARRKKIIEGIHQIGNEFNSVV